MCRALDWLQQQTEPATEQALADAIHCCHRNAQVILQNLRDRLGMAHIVAWQKRTGTLGGNVPMRLWAYGPGEDAERPAHDSNTERSRRRNARLKASFGSSIAHHIRKPRTHGGASVLMIEGEIAYRRGKPRGVSGGWNRKAKAHLFDLDAVGGQSHTSAMLEG